MSALNDIGKGKLVDVSKITGTPNFFLTGAVVKIGRSPANDFVIKEKTVSSKHAAIEQKNGEYFLSDLGSTNGTRVNGKEIEPNAPQKLNEGDVIYFDKFSFVFKQEKPVADRPIRIYEQTIDIVSQPLSIDTEAQEDAPAEVYSGTIDIESEPMTIDREATEDPEAVDDNGVPSKIGNYDVVKLLGRGGFGSVWKATDSKGMAVAVKLLNPDALENERAVRKFFHEALILSKLNHPNICRFIDFFPYNQNFAIVMDFVQGTDIKTMLKEQQGPLPFEKACRIAAQTLDAFHYAHQQTVLHRDIKPENITLDENDEVRVMDFGIAKLSSAETQHTSATMISPAYTSPERFDIKKTITHHSDIYSLGIFFYELFTGRHPYNATTR